MCVFCGCGHPEELPPHPHGHDHGTGGMLAAERERAILAANGRHAVANRAWFEERRILAINLVSSPGAGKTAVLVRTAGELAGRFGMVVIEGDQRTELDGERIRATGVPAVQINTGKACHLDAHGISHALSDLEPAAGGVVFIENVGNLVCPAGFDLGEARRVLVLSVTEGDDKPLKYPDIFRTADLVVINKIDLLPYVDFDVEACLAEARRLRPGQEALRLSATTGEGFDAWYEWIGRNRP